MYNLYTASIEITRKCNARCKHCILDAGKPLENELSYERIMHLIEELSGEGAKYLILTGGEPLLCPELPLYIQKAQSLGMKVVVMTNSFLVNDYWINLFKLYGVYLGISLDGADSETHDEIRGLSGLFDHFKEIVPKLVENKVYVGVSTTVMQSNYEKLDAIKDLLIDLKINAWQLQILKPCDRVSNQELLTEQQYYYLAEKIVEYRSKYSDKLAIQEADCIGYYSKLTPYLHIKNWRGCECGLNFVSISSNGDVKGCPNMNTTEGNVTNIHFKEIWRNHDSFKYNRLPDMGKLTGFCKECEYKFICRGGCPINLKTQNNNVFCLHKIETVGFDS